ncbi:enoyl-CoA hydratase/isomerase family protein [Rhizorhabdus argentea]|uniref:enoyl-CoA hydratase/isomerase family protein n=1 Tax=Rhizorhabdus argentea TaxID=1387174 RepID=UPI0030EC29EF
MSPHQIPASAPIAVDASSHPGVLIVTLDRPDERNAMSDALVESLLSLLDSAEAQSAGAILLAGAGRGFCAGSDLVGLAAMDMAARRAFEAASGLLARRIVAHPRPVIAAVHGFAIGGGLTLAAACDIVVSTAAAKWSLPEVPIGLFPAWGLEPVERRVGHARARRLAFGLDTLDGATAAQWGLVDMVAEDALTDAAAIAERLAAMPASQIAAVKDYFAVIRSGAPADEAANRHFIAACDTAAAAESFERYGHKR